jgi:hypothetical protein
MLKFIIYLLGVSQSEGSVFLLLPNLCKRTGIVCHHISFPSYTENLGLPCQQDIRIREICWKPWITVCCSWYSYVFCDIIYLFLIMLWSICVLVPRTNRSFFPNPPLFADLSMLTLCSRITCGLTFPYKHVWLAQFLLIFSIFLIYN